MRRCDVLGIMAAILYEQAQVDCRREGVYDVFGEAMKRAQGLLWLAENLSPEPNHTCEHQWISDTAGTRCMLCGRQS